MDAKKDFYRPERVYYCPACLEDYRSIQEAKDCCFELGRSYRCGLCGMVNNSLREARNCCAIWSCRAEPLTKKHLGGQKSSGQQKNALR